MQIPQVRWWEKKIVGKHLRIKEEIIIVTCAREKRKIVEERESNENEEVNVAKKKYARWILVVHSTRTMITFWWISFAQTKYTNENK